MSAACHYSINVAERIGVDTFGERFQHLFKVDIDDSRHKVERVVRELRSRFPVPEFKVSVSYWDCSGSDVTESFS